MVILERIFIINLICYSMKILIISIVTGIFLFGTYNSKKSLVEIEGMLYSDMGIVSIKSDNGKISKINRIESQGKSLELFVAPGLIDVQINGYMGIDFSGPKLTIEGVRKATKALWLSLIHI